MKLDNVRLDSVHLETTLVRAAAEPDPSTAAVAPPIHLATTFEHPADGEESQGHIYIRESNPTQSRLEEALAASEGGAAAFFCASGMAAGTILLQSLEDGAHVLFPDDVYHGFREAVQSLMPRWGLTATFVDMTDLDEVRRALRPETRLLWAESPSNPLLKIADLEALTGIAHEHGAEIVVDSTFATPVLQRPLELGADFVLHSATKYMGGHSDVQGGVLVLRESDRLAELLHIRLVGGAAASPFNAWLVLRGLRSMVCRVERHAANALAVAEALEGHPGIEQVYYPGLAKHPGHAIARRQMKAFGGMVSLAIAGGREAAIRVASRVRLFTNATSLGGVESLVEHRASYEGKVSTTPQNLLRLSIGLEHPEDLIADLRQALD